MSEEPLLASVHRLVHEYELKDDLDSAWAARPLGLIRDRGQTVLLLEDPGGEPLSRLIGPPLELGKFLRLAIALSAALGRLHERGLNHKDLKPANVLVNPATDQVWLTGFGIASRLPREQQSPEPPDFIPGTPAYMAPEQTGRMNRSVDHRSDLYSLGVTLYEMVTGQLPFSANDPLEWVHAHTAMQPIPPSGLVDLPEPISDIIMKLLAKAAEDRYQTAAGLVVDLRHCQGQWDRRRRVDPFSLGANDAPDRLLISERLYGRDDDIRMLISTFERVAESGRSELVLVSGSPGVGKSSVVNELHKVLVPRRGIFAGGKFDLYKRDIPYATLSQAFQGLLRKILGKTELELSVWRSSLLDALGLNGQLIIDIIPELEVIIGAQPPLLELSAQNAAIRFRMVFRRFLGVFASREHPLVLFLDDLQWLDIASLHLLQHLITDPEVRYVLLVGAYRDNEITASHPLLRTITDIRKAGASVQEIVLAPLSHLEVGHLIEDALRCGPGASSDLNAFVYEKTEGNPFFVIQFLKELADKSLLTFDAELGTYKWHITQIQRVVVTNNVVHLMTEKLNRLPATTTLLLKSLACLGNTAQIEVLARIQEQPDQVIRDALSAAVQAGLLLCDGSTYTFLHDRVQEAAYTLASEADRAATHLKIGRILASAGDEGAPKETIFEIVNQFDRAIGLIANEAERNYVATFFLSAAQQARKTTAYNSALKYLRRGRSLLADDSWKRQYPLTFAFELLTAECEFLTGELANAERRLEDLILHGANNLDIAAAYRLKITLHVVRSETDRTVEATLECLRLFGIVLEPDPTRQQLDAAFAEIWSALNEVKIEALAELPRATNPEIEAAITLLWAPAISKSEAFLGIYLCHIVGFTIANGVTAASTDGLGWFGNFVGHQLGLYNDGYRITRLARDLVEKHSFTAFRAKAVYALSMSELWVRPISQALETAREAFVAGSDSGDVLAACGSANAVVLTRFARGDHLDDVCQEAERAISYTSRSGYRDVGQVLSIEQRALLHLQGRTLSFETLDGDDFKETEFEEFLASSRNGLMSFCSWVSKGQSCYMAGRLDEASYAFEKAAPLYWVCPGHIQHFNYQMFSALTLSALLSRGLTRPEGKSRLRTLHEQLNRWAAACPSTFEGKAALLGAEIARIEGNTREAITLYEQAIRAAKNNGFINDEALSHELAARFHFDNGFNTSGDAHLRRSYDCYQRWGAHGKVRQLESAYPSLRGNNKFASLNSTNNRQISDVDVFAVLKATQAVSREIVIDDLVRTLLTITVETGGADRGLLILVRDDEPHIVAEATTADREIAITLRTRVASASELPESLLHYVMRTREALIVEDATLSPLFSSDVYVRVNQSKSLLCVPIVKQGAVSGVLYLENGLTAHAFTSQSLSLLEVLAAQAAISLENTRLYSDLQERESKVRRLVDSNIIGIFIWENDGQIIDANDAFLSIVEYSRDDLASRRLSLKDLTPEEWSHISDRRMADLKATGTAQPYEKEYMRKDGSRVPVLVGAARFEEGRDEGVGFVLDLTSSKRAEEAARESEQRYLEIQMQLAHANRVATIGELPSSIAHEINQPLSGVITNAETALLWLQAEMPNVAQAQAALTRIVRDGRRINDVIGRIRAMIKKAPSLKDKVDINEAILEVTGLTHGEAVKNGVLIHTQLGAELPVIEGDRVQLQQVILNLTMNAIEAMSAVDGEPKEVLISTANFDSDVVIIGVRDSGTGLDPANTENIFKAFYTTKTNGLGMGLSICRSIVEAHGGKLWASSGTPRGAVFQFTLPAERDRRAAF